MANFFTMTNHDLHGQMGIWGFIFSLGVGLLSGYLTYLTFNNSLHMICNSINRSNPDYYRYCTPSPSSNKQSIQVGIDAGISLTVIGGVLGFCSCIWLGQRLKAAEQTSVIRTVARNTTAITTTRNQGTTELNPLGQEVRNLETEVDTNHEVIELKPLGQEARDSGAEVIDIEQGQNQQIAEIQRRLNQLENQINQQQEAKIEVIAS